MNARAQFFLDWQELPVYLGRRGLQIFYFRGFCRAFGLDRDNEPISSARQSLDILGVLCGITDSFPQYRHGDVNAAVKIDIGVVRPEHLPDLIPGHNAAPVFDENSKNLKRLLPEQNLLRRSAVHPWLIPDKFAGSEVQLKTSESHAF